MKHLETAIEEHLARFTALLDEAFRRYGAADGLPVAIAHAVRATPRHRFVHRFRAKENGPLHDADAEPLRHLPTIYSDVPQLPADIAGNALPSSNSQSSYILWLVDKLGLQPGHRVLEIGSGSGWLAAIMARLVGADGRVTGVEIIPELAERARQDLEALGIGNVEIVNGDGTQGYLEGAPYDCAIITAAVWDVPLPLFAQIVDGGRIVIPIAQSGGDGCHVTVLRRTGDRFVAERVVHGYFVPFASPGQMSDFGPRALEDLPFWPDIGVMPVLRRALWLGGDGERFGPAAKPFRTFLALTERNFAVFERGLVGPERNRAAFGLFEAVPSSLALCRPGEVLGFGAPDAVRRLASAYAHWTDLGMPGVGAFDLDVVPAAAAPSDDNGIWVAQRGHAALVWRLKQAGESLRLLANQSKC
jgi:protein-L-isoaspartate(D-aspartate) O-methyltransferase